MTRSALLLPILSGLLLCPPMASAQERPLIWEFSKSSDTSYLARLGSRLPAGRTSSMGADVRIRGPKIEDFGNPVALWGTVLLSERAQAGKRQSARVDARIDGADRKRSISVNNTFVANLPGLDAELRQDYALDHRPRNDDRLHARTSHSLRLSSPKTRTVVQLEASRTDKEAWRTRLDLEQPLRKAISIGATLEDAPGESTKSRFRASYRHTW